MDYYRQKIITTLGLNLFLEYFKHTLEQVEAICLIPQIPAIDRKIKKRE